jgi:bla regulator protein blaR1
MNAVPEVLAAVLNSLWQAVLVAALVWLALRFMGRINAATRYLIWWAVLAVVVLLPLAPRLKTLWRLVPPAILSPVNPALAGPRPTALLPVEPPAIVTLTQKPAASWPLWILALWAAVSLYRLVQIVRSYFYLRGVKRHAREFPQALPDCGVRRPVRLLASDRIASPMAVGFLRPAVMLPASLPEEISKPQLDHVLLHELAHLARRDDWTNLSLRLIGALAALHPVVIWILRQIEREREMACDDWVVAMTGQARPYAASLARLFELRWARRRELLASGIFGAGSRLGDRIETLLQRGRVFSARASLARVSATAALLLALAAAGSLAPRWIAFAQRIEFEVASIKPSNSTNPQFRIASMPGGRFAANNASLKMLIQTAYDVRGHQISGGPNWIDSDKFDIEAEPDAATPIPPGPAGAPQMRSMLQSLLMDRFKLGLHRETKEEPVYELVVARGGPKLRVAADSATGPQGLRMGLGQFTGMAASMSILAQTLAQAVGRSVIDKTGLTGRYDFELKWTPVPGEFSFGAPGVPGPDGLGGDALPPPDPSGPSLFTALQEELGLKLESARGPVEILVIDHAEKPDAN